MKFPVFSLHNRELAFRDGFARDCLLQRRVNKPSVPRERTRTRPAVMGPKPPTGIEGCNRESRESATRSMQKATEAIALGDSRVRASMLPGLRGINTAGRVRAFFLTVGKCGAGIVFAQQGKRAPDHGGTGVDRETYPRSLVGSRVYDSRVVPVPRPVGSDLGGSGLVGLGRAGVACSISRRIERTVVLPCFHVDSSGIARTAAAQLFAY